MRYALALVVFAGLAACASPPPVSDQRYERAQDFANWWGRV